MFNIYTVIKKNSDIASLFQKHQAKKAAAAASASNHSTDPVERAVEEQTHERIEEIANPISLFGRPYRIVDYLLLAGLV